MIRVAPREPRVIPAASVGLYASAASAKIDFGSASNLDNINPYTSAVLFYYRASNAGKQTPELFMKGEFPDRNSMYFVSDAGDSFTLGGYVDRATTDSSAQAVDNTFALGRWFLAMMTYDNTDGIRLYVGAIGKPISEVSYASRTVGAGSKNSDSSYSVWVGGRNNTNGSQCDYAFAAFWSGILTLKQMRELQAWLSPEMIRVGPPPASLKGGCRLWTFPGAHGYNKYIDFSGFGNHGAPSGSEIRLAKPAPYTLFQISRPAKKFPIIFTVGQVTETDLAQVLIARRRYTLAQANETDLAQAFAVDKVKAIAQVPETDLAQTIVARKVKAVAQITETDIPQAITKIKRLVVAQVIETDTSQPIAKAKIKTVTLVEETDISQSIAKTKIKAIGRVSETDTAQPILTTSAILVLQVAETDLAQALFPLKRVSVVQAAEVDEAQPITAQKIKQIGIVTETDFAQAIANGGAITVVIGQAFETDSALQIGVTYTSYIGTLTLHPRSTVLSLHYRETELTLNRRSMELSLQELDQ